MVTNTNLTEFSVGDLALALKRTLETNFEHIRVRGELSRVTIAASGHLYSDLKDQNAVINIICWRTQLARLGIKPEEGLDVICTGKITTYPARSNYQLVVERMELAGQGALLKMLEDRRKKLLAEGLFDSERKRALPYLPDVIGVVTSPTGAVIRDILHRLDDRLPRRVLVWPVRVQGEGAADEITAAIGGFNALPKDGPVPRPDVIIVARGGGSLEDLMPFNDEKVVRAAADSTIPLISAVGHETDTTLIDYAADLRAPTPTAAAEKAVPVRTDLLLQLDGYGARLRQNLAQTLRQHKTVLDRASAGLGKPQDMVALKTQALDQAGLRLTHNFRTLISRKAARVIDQGARVLHPGRIVADQARHIGRLKESLGRLATRLLAPKQDTLAATGRILESLSFERVLDRGFVVVRTPDNQIVTTPDQAAIAKSITLQFAGGRHIRVKPEKP